MTNQPSPFVWIRPMTQEDIPFVAALEAEIFSDAWSEKLYQETLESGRYDCQVLELAAAGEGAVATEIEEMASARRLAGYFCGQVILDEAEVHRIAVQPALRGIGYGQMLLEDFLQRVRKEGVATVLLEVRASNAPAIGLYEKNGFVAIGVRKGYYQKPKEDAQILQCCF
ncbi:MAG: ribosomal protein S18-alanine N-acetyltransferase [Lachnospiraceae bacterium]|nr:ribosomal protein S18-alanine N-acetyltransferase [Lachnospiraceae bacterium]